MDVCVYSGKSRDIVANVQDSGFEINEFELRSRYYIHFLADSLKKVMTLSSYGLKSNTVFPLK